MDTPMKAEVTLLAFNGWGSIVPIVSVDSSKSAQFSAFVFNLFNESVDSTTRPLSSWLTRDGGGIETPICCCRWTAFIWSIWCCWWVSVCLCRRRLMQSNTDAGYSRQIVWGRRIITSLLERNRFVPISLHHGRVRIAVTTRSVSNNARHGGYQKITFREESEM